MHRHHGRDHRSGPGGRGPRPPARRTPPPPSTGLEAEYLERKAVEGAALVLTLSDGTKVSGTLVDQDRDQLTIEDSSGTIIVRKTDIRYIEEGD